MERQTALPGPLTTIHTFQQPQHMVALRQRARASAWPTRFFGGGSVCSGGPAGVLPSMQPVPFPDARGRRLSCRRSSPCCSGRAAAATDPLPPCPAPGSVPNASPLPLHLTLPPQLFHRPSPLSPRLALPPHCPALTLPCLHTALPSHCPAPHTALHDRLSSRRRPHGPMSFCAKPRQRVSRCRPRQHRQCRRCARGWMSFCTRPRQKAPPAAGPANPAAL
eukprot:350288-Chlamydomonas_euryale.AAC.9